jgi:hypothetical protein
MSAQSASILFRRLFVIFVLLAVSASPMLSTQAGVTRPNRWTQGVELIAGDGAANSQFGTSVDVDGDTAIVGAVGTLSGNPVGSAYVYTRINNSWNLQAKLTPSDGSPPKSFGNSVSLSGNTALIGAGGSSSENGAAYVFVRTGTTWTQQAKLTASDGAVNDLFGSVVALDADTAVIGARLDDVGANTDQGSAYVFVRSGTSWTQQAKLTANDGIADDNFAVGLDVLGNIAIIGANDDDNNSLTDNGGAYVYTRSGTTWTQSQKLVASDRATNDKFGRSVVMDGINALIGATGADSGYFFTRSGGVWSEQSILKPASGFGQVGISVALEGNMALLSDNFNVVNGQSNAGAIYVFTRTGATWTEVDRLTVNDFATQDQLSFGLAISGNTAIGGAPFKDLNGNSNQGVAYIFDLATRPDTVGLFKDGTFFLRNSNTSGVADITFAFGSTGFYPVAGDWNSDGLDSVGVYNNTNGTFFLRNSNSAGAADFTLTFGDPGDTPFAGKWEAARTHDGVGVFRPSNGILFLKNTLTTGFSDYNMVFGGAGDVGIGGDWDGDGVDSIGIYRDSSKRWFLNNDQTSGVNFSEIDFVWDTFGGTPATGDWDGNGTTTTGFYNATSTYFVLHNINAVGGADTFLVYGVAGARPISGKWTPYSTAPTPPQNILIRNGTQSGNGSNSDSGDAD